MQGWVDLQVNGGFGVDFSNPGLTVDDVHRLSVELETRGTTLYCPTIVTCTHSIYEANLPVLAKAMEEMPSSKNIAGIHLEGPFISKEPGAVGAHPACCVQAPSVASFQRLQDLSGGKIRLVTLAPELPGALDLIEYLVANNVVVSLGHSLAGYDDVRRAADSGVRLATHLGNAIPTLIHRHDNPMWAVLADPRISAMIITDGHHLPPAVIAAFIQAKGTDKIIVTSDMVGITGCQPGEYTLFQSPVRLCDDGSIRHLSGGNLAGSTSLMADCMNHLCDLIGMTDLELRKVGCNNPLAAICTDQKPMTDHGCRTFLSFT